MQKILGEVTLNLRLNMYEFFRSLQHFLHILVHCRPTVSNIYIQEGNLHAAHPFQ